MPCNHCQNIFPKEALIEVDEAEEKFFFCCNGCKNAFFLLKEYHIEGFYSKIKTLTPIQKIPQLESAYYDNEAFVQHYVKKLEGGGEQVEFVIGHIHCSACVWLIENVIAQMQGVEDIQIHYTNHRAKIKWNPQKTKLSTIVQTIYDLGYDVSVGHLSEAKEKQQKREYYIKLIVAVFCTMNVMWIAVAQYAGYFQGMQEGVRELLGIASWILASPVLFYSGSIFYQNAYTALKRGMVGMDTLVFSGAFLTYVYSIYAFFVGGETYFESVSMILTFVLVGKFLEVSGRNSAGEVLELLYAQIPQSVRVIRGGERVQVLPQNVEVGELIEVFAGEKIALDGVLVSSNALLDERALSGEAEPTSKQSGDCILSGSVNLFENFIYEARKSFEESALNHLIVLMEDSLKHKPQIENLANTLSSKFSKGVLALALMTLGVYLYGGDSRALSVAVSVIIIACPCALALATPISSIVGLGRAYQEGILFKQSRFLETLSRIDYVCFDKTGTLTQGEPQVIDEKRLGDYDVAQLRAFLECSTHPIAQGVLEYLPKAQGDYVVRDFKVLECRGIEARVGDDVMCGGSEEFLKEKGVIVEGDQSWSGSFFGFALNGKLQGVFLLQDRLKSDSLALIEGLKKMGIGMCILSGDRESSVKEVAEELGIQTYFSQHSPTQKLEVVQSLRQEGKKIAMIGDGINDILALTQSEVGMSIVDKSDLALHSSDIVLLEDKMSLVLGAFVIARQTFKNIKQNIAFSVLYNCITIPLAMMGYVLPIVAALSMSMSSLVVVGNALRLKKITIYPKGEK
ncbi:copper-translocating P-type ATPase [Helicobacter enhydrae]|uniref:Copper-transporting ATPase n=1 Tax=Helicobacter enhydrae TaxID=222136 RepID=A0A1B1U7N6_9HELI|nr:copper-translocating P-type ATPase [Helicobacter enhydrae]